MPCQLIVQYVIKKLLKKESFKETRGCRVAEYLVTGERRDVWIFYIVFFVNSYHKNPTLAVAYAAQISM